MPFLREEMEAMAEDNREQDHYYDMSDYEPQYQPESPGPNNILHGHNDLGRDNAMVVLPRGLPPDIVIPAIAHPYTPYRLVPRQRITPEGALLTYAGPSEYQWSERNQRRTYPLPLLPDFVQNCLSPREPAEYDVTCTICQTDFFDAPNEIVQISPCQHEFHRPCLMEQVNGSSLERNECRTCSTFLFRRNVLTPRQVAECRHAYEGANEQVLEFQTDLFVELLEITDRMFWQESRMGPYLANYFGRIGFVAHAWYLAHPDACISVDHAEQGDPWLYYEIGLRVEDHLHEQGWLGYWLGLGIRSYLNELEREMFDGSEPDSEPDSEPAEAPADDRGVGENRRLGEAPEQQAQGDGQRSPNQITAGGEVQGDGEDGDNDDAISDASSTASTNAGGSDPEETPAARTARLHEQQRTRRFIRENYTVIAEFPNISAVKNSSGTFELTNRRGEYVADIRGADGFIQLGNYAIFYRKPE
ncbi:hypothetical protein BDV95DRAFT_177536 [Massariosphaeria phaeospora]|uniref:RING-type domain-containing protein n=1 Tax=Massariosphaeria phaeospora TaxID=100035 RepID=A0A7C8I3Y3_9PLEO|nr:hypothetical protein BDV95DRAFT_177536 [Massariosphaeria phaeospora]